MTTGDWTGAVDFALAQTAEGAAILDVCLISDSRDEVRDAARGHAEVRVRVEETAAINGGDEHALLRVRAPGVLEGAKVLAEHGGERLGGEVTGERSPRERPFI